MKRSFYFSEIDSVNLEYSSIDGCKLGIKRGYITKDYILLLVGKKEMGELKKIWRIMAFMYGNFKKAL